MKVLIIDDETPARELVINYLKDNPEISDIKEATNGFEGIKLINSTKPDVILLDIQMPKLDGFEMLELIENPPPVIFCTAYDEFAIKAFEQNAIDYLLKPFSKSRLFEAISKVIARRGSKEGAKSSPTLFIGSTPLERIVIKSAKEIIIIPVLDIIYLKAADDYVEVYTNNRKYLKQRRLKYYESALNKNIFIRIHRQYIVHINCITKLDKFGKESYLAQVTNGDTIMVSASGYGLLKQKMDL